MADLDTAAALDAIAAVVDATGALQVSARIGAPESPPARVFAFLMVSASAPVQAPLPIIRMQGRIRVWFAYAVRGAEETAERTLAAAVDAFWRGFYVARNAGTFAGVLEGEIDLDASAAAAGHYITINAAEVRAVPVDVTYQQSFNPAA